MSECLECRTPSLEPQEGGPIERDWEGSWRSLGIGMRLLRLGAGLTMGDVAHRLGVSVSLISSLERGRDPRHQKGLES